MRAILAVVAALALLAGCTSGGGTGERQAAPAITGELLDGGGTYHLADHRGEVVVVNFWASWCAPCRREIVDLEATYAATKADGVTFVGINVRDNRDQARAFVAGQVSYPSIFDPAGRTSVDYSRFGVTALPATVVIDRQGRVAHVLRVEVRQADLEPLVDAVAAEPRP